MNGGGMLKTIVLWWGSLIIILTLISFGWKLISISSGWDTQCKINTENSRKRRITGPGDLIKKVLKIEFFEPECTNTNDIVLPKTKLYTADDDVNSLGDKYFCSDEVIDASRGPSNILQNRIYQ